MNDRVVFLGSGEFGIPTLRTLHRQGRVALVVTQPDRPAGRGRKLTGTPIATEADSLGLPVLRVEDVNAPDAVERIRAASARDLVIIAFGQKLKPVLLEGFFAINLHGSLLPRHRGAAPVQWSIISGDALAGLTVIDIAQRMDAGRIYASASTPIGEVEIAGELHDRLAAMGPDLIEQVLASRGPGIAQDESLATRAPKIARADATVHFDQDAFFVQRKIHGLSPKPGCTIRLGQKILKIARTLMQRGGEGEAGLILADGTIQCRSGRLLPLEVQPPGGSIMSWDAYRNGHQVIPGMRCEACVDVVA